MTSKQYDNKNKLIILYCFIGVGVEGYHACFLNDIRGKIVDQKLCAELPTACHVHDFSPENPWLL